MQNGYYPATYQQYGNMYQYGQTMQPNQVSVSPMTYGQQQQSNGIIWVQGEIGARAYPPPMAGSSVLLMDSDDKRFYIKSTDASGMPMPLRIFSYTEEVSTQRAYSQNDPSQYITRQEFEEYMRNMKTVDAEIVSPQKTSGRRDKSNGE